MSDPQKSEAPKATVTQRLSTVTASLDEDRFSTGITGLDACLSESDEGKQGLPYGISVLISGMPGSGKSTIATFIANAQTGREALYLHGEERAERVKQRWNRLKLEGTDPFLAPLKSGEEAAEAIREASMDRGLGVCIGDSVQCLTWGGRRGYEDQFQAADFLSRLVSSNGGSMILLSHVDKSGKSHKGASELAHAVDIHLHLMTSAKKSERVLEVRKNRMGRAGFQVPVNITISGITVGTPAPISGASGLVMARTALEKATETAYTLLLEGRTLNGYDFDEVQSITGSPVSGGMWRSGLSLAVKRMARDGYVIREEKIKGRTSFTIESAPAPSLPEVPLDMGPPSSKDPGPTPVSDFPLELD